MKKSSFIALIMGTAAGVLFSLGMCMALLPEWNAFGAGIALGSAGLILGIITLIVWCRMENRTMPRMSGKNVFRTVYAVIGALVLGTGMSMCLIGTHIVWGTLVGMLGIIMLISLIPMIKGIK